MRKLARITYINDWNGVSAGAGARGIAAAGWNDIGAGGEHE